MKLRDRATRALATDSPKAKAAATSPKDTGLRADSHVERAEALARRKATACREHDETVAKLNAQIQKSAAAMVASNAENEAAVHEKRQQLHTKFVNEFHEDIGKLLPAFFKEPTRAVGSEIGSVLTRYDARARLELCAPRGSSLWSLSVDLFAAACCDTLMPDCPASAINVFSKQGFGLGPRYAQIVQTLPEAVKAGGGALSGALEQVELALRAAGSKGSGPVSQDSIRRYRVKREAGTAIDCVAATAKLEQELEAERRKRVERDHVEKNYAGARLIGT